ncbi:MAG: hypothetical protein M1503_11540 [Thaumarchaeota archaeon]|nr:hypothetical protein [Nitrososphaerota archaeon]
MASSQAIASGELEVEVSEAEKLPEGKEIEKDYTEAFNSGDEGKKQGSSPDAAINPEDKIDLEELAAILPEGQSALLKATLNDPLNKDESNKVRARFARVIQKRVSWMSEYGDIANLAIAMIAPVLKRIFKSIEQGKQKQQDKENKAKKTLIDVQKPKESATAKDALHKPDVQALNQPIILAGQGQQQQATQQLEDPIERAMKEFKQRESKVQ